MNKFNKEKFESVVAEHDFEVFSPEEVASFYKEGVMKSAQNELTDDEKKEFVADCMSLSKAIVVDNDGKESLVYFRKSQVNWETSEDGVLMKGVAGVYADTPTNRLLGRVGEAYIPDDEFMKSLENDTENSIAKAARTGRYADTPENRRLHRVGQPYKKREGNGSEKKLPEGWKKSIRVVDDEDSWNSALEEAMGKEYDKVFTEDLSQDENAWFKKMEEMIPKYMSAKQVQDLIDEVGTETEDDE